MRLSAKERNRKFLAGGAKEPDDPAMRYCPFCKCKNTVDIPADNLQKMQRNEQKLEVYRAERAEWDRKKLNGEECTRVGKRG